MADPLSIVASVLTFIETANKIREKFKDARDARKSTQQLAALLGTFRTDLQKVERYLRSGDVDRYMEPYRALYEENPKYDKDPGRLHDLKNPKFIPGPVLREVEPLLAKLEIKLRSWDEEQCEMLGNDQDGKEDSRLRSSLRKQITRLGLRKRARQTKWAFEKKDTEREVQMLNNLRSHLDRIRDQLDHELLVDADKARRLKQSNEEFSQIKEWINGTKFEDEHRHHSDTFLDPTVPNDWLIQDPVFHAWEEGRSWHLAMYGAPGSGKTVLASQIISHLRETRKSDQRAVIFAYLKHEEAKIQKLDHVLSLFLKQILVHRGPNSITPQIYQMWQEANQSGQSRPDATKVLELLRQELESLDRSYIVIDGLDEAEDDTRHDIFNTMLDLINKGNRSQDSGKVSFLVTSRRLGKQERKPSERCQGRVGPEACQTHSTHMYYAGVTGKKGGFLCKDCAVSEQATLVSGQKFDSIDMDLKTPTEAIRQYVESLLLRDITGQVQPQAAAAIAIAELSDMDTDDELESEETQTPLSRILRKNKQLRTTIVDSILKSSENLYMLARMQWDYVRENTSKNDIERALHTVPKGVNDSYNHTMVRLTKPPIVSTKAELARRIVMWVSLAKGSFTLNSLQHAMAIPPDQIEQSLDHEQVAFDEGEEKDKASLMAITRGLVTMWPDRTLHLSHKTAYEYFSAESVQTEWFPNGPVYMAQSCLITLAYTNLHLPCEDAKDLLQGSRETELVEKRVGEFPFAAYAAQFWGSHSLPCQTNPTVLKSMQTFLALTGNLASALQLAAYQEEIYRIGGLKVRKGLNALHLAAWFGLYSAFEYLVYETGIGINDPDTADTKWTPLIYACRAGHYKAVQKLLSMGADGNRKDPKGTPAIIHAAANVDADKQNAAIQALCDSPFLDINSALPSGHTALIVAAMRGYTPVVTTLLNHEDIDLDATASGGYTALAMAAQRGFPDVVNMLLAHEGTNDNILNLATEDDMLTPLHLAAKEGYADIVVALLDRGVQTDVQDKFGGTALRRAIDGGHAAVINIFVGRSLLDDKKDNDGKGLLFSAVEGGHTDLVRLLVEKGFSVNESCNSGQTPLHYAARAGKLDIVQLLVQNRANVSLKDDNGHTAAELAWNEGANVAMVEFLNSTDPSTPPVDLNRRDLPAVALARTGSSDLLEERAKRVNSDILEPDSTGDTPLIAAIQEKNFECARIILKVYADRKESIDTVNSVSRTPLHEAVETNNLQIVKDLLSHEPCPDFEIKDRSQATPLTIATRWHNDEIALELLEAGAEVDPACLPPEQTMRLAIEKGKLESVSKLARAGAPIHHEHLDLAIEKWGNAGENQIWKVLRRNWTFVRANTEKIKIGQMERTLESVIDEPEGVPQLPSPPADDLIIQLPSAPTTKLPDFTQLDREKKPAFRQREPALLAD